MNYCKILVLFSVPVLFINLYAQAYNLGWLASFTNLIVYLPLIFGFCRKLELKNLNVLAFFFLSAIAAFFSIFQEQSIFWFAAIFSKKLSYVFIAREAFKHFKVEIGSKYMLMIFFILIGVNVYFVLEHLNELQSYLGGISEFTLYTMYYLSLFGISLVALLYYMNSYSRKSVYFISLVMALVISDILGDMAFFYLPDTSVLFLISLLHFAAIFLAFQFFVTEEKKLRLMNLL